MATLTELFGLLQDTGLRNKVAAAILIAAEAIRTEDAGTANHANRLLWSRDAFQGSVAMADRMYPALLGANAANTVAQIQSATDTAIQTAVTNAIDIFATGA